MRLARVRVLQRDSLRALLTERFDVLAREEPAPTRKCGGSQNASARKSPHMCRRDLEAAPGVGGLEQDQLFWGRVRFRTHRAPSVKARDGVADVRTPH